MRTSLRVAMGQMTSGDTHELNIATLDEMAARAREAGAELLALPEVAGLMNRNAAAAREMVVAADTDPFLARARALSAELGLWMQPGTVPVTGAEGKFRNHGVLIDDTGAVRAGYDKIHLFDVALEGQRPIGESKRFEAGTEGVVVETPWGRWGLSICYDLRFPGLYRDYAQAGAGLIFIPSAFTVPTGRAHWEVLLRARAIETGSFIIAAAQVGHHADGRETWGHSMIVDPWGEVLCDMGGEAPGLAVVDLDLRKVEAARAQIPSLTHDRVYRLRVV